MAHTPFVVTIDGPCGSGKSSTAQAIAHRLSWILINSGSFYRALAFWALQQGLDTTDRANIDAFLGVELTIEDGVVVAVNGQDVTMAELKSVEVSPHSSHISVHREVREHVNLLIQNFISDRVERGAIIEGRDAGSLIFPAAQIKLYLSAGLTIRADRITAATGELFTAEMVDARDHNDHSKAYGHLFTWDEAQEAGYRCLNNSHFGQEVVIDWALRQIERAS